ncbi:MAG: hypothetical protein ACI87F_000415, partial [Candidatus Azotimanducaceae bacterium]
MLNYEFLSKNKSQHLFIMLAFKKMILYDFYSLKAFSFGKYA